jgi:ribosomal protein S18 acetylase RimI-like enzyme
VLALSILREPIALRGLPRALKLVIARRGEKRLGEDPLAEIVAIGVRPEYLTADFIRRTGKRVAEALVLHAASHFRREGMKEMRMVVDADNRAALFFYHRLGARFEAYEQAVVPSVQVWLDLDKDSLGV